MHNVLDVCISITRGSGRTLGPGIREFESFLGSVKWHRADRRVPFGAQKAREFQGPTPSHFLKEWICTHPKHYAQGCIKNYELRMKIFIPFDAYRISQEAEKKDPALLAVEDIKEQCRFIRRSVETKEPRYCTSYLILATLPECRLS
jgi:hypothetical protein